jgi:hypothetical protein
MPRELRMSSLYDVPPQPKWLRRLQIGALAAQVVALILLWSHMAFGVTWPNRVSYDAVVPLILVTNAVVQIYVLRWHRSRKQE